MIMETAADNKFNLNQTNRILVSIGVALLVALSWATPLDDYSKEYVDDSLKQALISFGIARSLNAGISVAQSSEVSAGFFSVDVGQLLDPLNDTVEDFSTVMKWASISLVVQKTILTLVSDVVFQIALLVVSLALLYDYFKPTPARSIIRRLFLTVVAARFLIVLVVLLNSAVDSLVINHQLDEKLNGVESVATMSWNADKIAENEQKQKQGIQDSIANIEVQIQALGPELKALKNNESVIQKELDELNSKQSVFEKYSSFESAKFKDHSAQQLDELTVENSGVKSVLDGEISVLQKQLESLNNELAELKKTSPSLINGDVAETITNTAGKLLSYVGGEDQEVLKLDKEIKLKNQEIEQVESSIEGKKQDLEDVIVILEELEKQKKYLFHSNLNLNIDAKNVELQTVEDEIDQSEGRIEQFNKERKGLVTQLEGSFWSRLVDEAKGFKSSIQQNVNIKLIKSKLESIVEDLIYVMGMFLLRTMLLPILFLYLGYRVFVNIWATRT